MEKERSITRDIFEMAFGATLVAVTIPFVFTSILMDKMENVIKLVQQINEDIIP